MLPKEKPMDIGVFALGLASVIFGATQWALIIVWGGWVNSSGVDSAALMVAGAALMRTARA